MIREQLPNGLNVAILPERSVPLVTFDMWVRVGSGDEPTDLQGISHYLEHMLFKGTPTLGPGEYDQIVEQAGGYLNAATSMDYTHYYVTIPSRHFDEVFAAFADVMRNSTIDPEETELERQVILEEISRKIDSPFGYLFDETIPQLFSDGPYTHPVIGSRESVRAITRDQLHEHYVRHYAPANMFLNIAGDIDPQAALAAVRQHFGDWERPHNPWREAAPATAWRPMQPRTLPMDWNEAYFIMAFPAPAAATARDMALADLAEVLLGEGRSSRLVNELQEKRQLVSSIGTYFMTHRHDAPLLIYGTCKPENVDQVYEETTRLLEKLVDDGPTGREMKRIRRSAANAHLYSLETNAGRASTAGYSQAMLGDLSLLNGYAELLESIPEAELREYLQLLDGESSFFVTRRPEGAIPQ